MNLRGNLVAFHNLAADLNSRLNRLSSSIERYEEITPLIHDSLNSSGLAELCINNLSGIEFEEWCSQLLRKIGYESVRMTRASGDFGGDILAEKDGVHFAIQCKRYTDSVGVDAIRQAHSAKDYYCCDVAVVMTNSFFTDQAKELAAANRVVLWDRDVIDRWTELL